MSAEAKKRVQYVDVVKGIAIVWIVFYHLMAPCAGKNQVINHLMDVMLISFFFFSGYFYRPGKRSLKENIGNRAKSLMSPFFKYSLFFWAVGTIHLVATGGETIREAFLCLRNFFAGCIWNRVIQNWFGWEYYSLGRRHFYLADFWFLLAMLFASILFFLAVDHVLQSKPVAIAAIAALFALTGILVHFGIDLPYNLQLVPFWTAFLLLGAFFGQQKLFDLEFMSGGAKWGAGICLLAVGTAVSLWKTPSMNVFRGSFGENEVLSMLLCIAAAIPFIWGAGLVCAQIEKVGVRITEIAWLGSHSLLIYLYHMFFAWILCTITGFSIQYEEPSSAGTIAKSLLLTLTCLALGVLVNLLSDAVAAKKKAR